MSTIVKDHRFLTQVSTKVENVEEARSIIEKLENTLRKHSNGYGLSAIQIGIPKRIAVIKYDKYEHEFIHLINPEIIERGKEFTFHGEGCLSFPDVYMETKRLEDFTITNDVIDGDSFRQQKLYFYHPNDNSCSKFESVAVEHEMDHFSGLTILDYGKTPKPLIPTIRSDVKIGRNDPCPCGAKNSNGIPVKYKKCCLNKGV